MVPSLLVTDQPEPFRLDRLIIAPRYHRNITLTREMEDAGVYTAYPAKTEKQDVGPRHCFG